MKNIPFFGCVASLIHSKCSLQLGILIAATAFVLAPQAGAQPSNIVKWDQPPALLTPSNIFNGWNELSWFGQKVAADDWVCTTTNPVTKIRWWGSFLNWTNSQTPPVIPDNFRIHFWTDKPKNAANPFSHPDSAIKEIICTNYTVKCVGLDYDPRTGQFETCYLFEQTLDPQDWFFQNPLNGTNIYWLSIAADYFPGHTPANPWGWKTRQRDPTSPAPDAAVSIDNPATPVLGSIYVSGSPLLFPWPSGTGNEWDLAFELVTGGATFGGKWEQRPDLTTNGMDVNATFDPVDTPLEPPVLLASDFRCTQQGFITNIVVWGSWLNDKLPFNGQGLPDPNAVEFTLSIHADIAATNGNFSRPGNMLWRGTFPPGFFNHTVLVSNITEGWLTPSNLFLFPGDHVCHEYQFTLPSFTNEPFFQFGSPANPVVFWLDVQARILNPQPAPYPRFGWKSSVTNWNDDSTWANLIEPQTPPGPPPGAWNELRYPPTHPKQGQSVDLAFRLNTQTSSGTETVKWSQPPLLAQNPGNWYNGWDEPSLYRIGPVIADDWLCTNARPVSDIHWWGSFLNWSAPTPPPQGMAPVAFHLAIWTDVPVGSPNNQYPFSHPGTVLWEQIAAGTDPALTFNWVGWDVDPRTDCPEPESTFFFSYNIPSNNWFNQAPGTNTFWLSIAAIYPNDNPGQYPFGWKTRPHRPVPPDDAVRIFDPLAPVQNTIFVFGQSIEYPTNVSWDMAFQLTSPQGPQETNLDFGDAPDFAAAPLYPTLLANNGARHVITAGVRMGALIDAEADGQPNLAATGDDLAGLPDEDGVLFTSPIVPGFNATVQVTASVNGFLNAWLDFGADGSWAQPGDKIFANIPLVPGINNLVFMVPPGAAAGTNTFARFRYTTGLGSGLFTGLEPTGEVEDYRVLINQPPTSLGLDFGDAPDSVLAPGYRTLLANNGARHVAFSNFCLGTNIDVELDGQPHVLALGDDLAGIDDEDGVFFTTNLKRGTNACVNVFLTSLFGPGRLDGWVDFNKNGTFDHPAEQVFAGVPLALGLNAGLCFPVPNTALTGRTFARFRLTSFGGTTPVGLAPNGEVEDYQVQICQNGPTNGLSITNISVTNVIGGQEIKLQWTSETNVWYQAQVTAPLTNGMNTWTNVGNAVLGPANLVLLTNVPVAERYYRICVMDVCH